MLIAIVLLCCVSWLGGGVHGGLLGRLFGLEPREPSVEAKNAAAAASSPANPQQSPNLGLKPLLQNWQDLGAACGLHLVRETKLQEERRKAYRNRTAEQISAEYMRTYQQRRAEKGRGMLNQIPAQLFPSFGGIASRHTRPLLKALFQPLAIDEHLLLRYAEFAALAYCPSADRVNAMAQLNTRMGNYEMLVQGQSLVNQSEPVYRVFYQPQLHQLVLSFRGTNSAEDARDNLDTQAMEPTFSIITSNATVKATSNAFAVHGGYWKRFERYRERVVADVKRSILQVASRGNASRSEVDVVVVGHSLGAAWGLLTAADLVANQQVSVTAVYTYGMPLVANQVFADAMVSTIGANRVLRATSENDLVPHVGFDAKDNDEERHPRLAMEYFATTNIRAIAAGSLQLPPVVTSSSTATIRTCRGGQDPTCSQKYKCKEWSWIPHSEFAGISIRMEFCRMNQTVSPSVYSR